MWPGHLFMALAWILYCVLHSVLASNRLKQKASLLMKGSYKFYRPAYVLFSFAGLVFMLWWLVILKSPHLIVWNLPVFYLGFVIMLAGLGLMAVCIKKYFLSLSGLKTLLNESNSNELIITGIHRYVRHPLYLGTFAFIWGLWLLIPTLSFLISNIIITVYTVYGIKLEERKLVAEFGEQYRQYQETVPKLFPRLI